MNIHPIFVHFPIALLTIYAILELLRFKKIKNQTYWFYVKAVFVIFGSLGTFVALATGDSAAYNVLSYDKTMRPLISTHETFADLTTIIFALIAAGYLISWCNKENFGRFFIGKKFIEKFWLVTLRLSYFFVETRFVILLALVGLFAVTITGGLGGVIVYGSNADPFFGVIYKLFFQ